MSKDDDVPWRAIIGMAVFMGSVVGLGIFMDKWSKRHYKDKDKQEKQLAIMTEPLEKDKKEEGIILC